MAIHKDSQQILRSPDKKLAVPSVAGVLLTEIDYGTGRLCTWIAQRQGRSDPEYGKWTVPGGSFTNEDELPEIAAARELGEETSLEVDHTRLRSLYQPFETRRVDGHAFCFHPFTIPVYKCRGDEIEHCIGHHGPWIRCTFEEVFLLGDDADVLVRVLFRGLIQQLVSHVFTECALYRMGYEDDDIIRLRTHWGRNHFPF